MGKSNAEMIFDREFKKQKVIIKDLFEIAKGLEKFVGHVSCSGYKCRLPQCGDCSDEQTVERAGKEMNLLTEWLRRVEERHPEEVNE